jgi:ATP-dependent protease ClpP protease subunit
VMQPGSFMMVHEAFGGCVGDAAELAAMSAVLDKISDNIAQIYASRTRRGTAADWRAAMAQESWYTADEAVGAGLADAVA